MNWTIEKVRELPEDNWLGVKRTGPHSWQIGDSTMMIMTGDGGVVQYLNQFEEIVREHINTREPEKVIVDGGSMTTQYTISIKDLEKTIKDTLFNGMA